MSATASPLSLTDRDAVSHSWAVKLMPSLTDLAFLLPLFLALFMLPGPTFLLADGDTGWHIRTGDWILAHRAVPRVDVFSFTKPGQSWFAWEWGWDVSMALVHRAGGLAGVAFLNLALLSLVAVLLFRLIRRHCETDFVAIAVTLLAVCGTMIHWLARPHLISWLFMLVFSHAILSAERGSTKGLRWLPLVMCLWANLHGGFFIGIILLVTSAAGIVASELLSPQPAWTELRRAWPLIKAALLCGAATLVNPYGWQLHRHVVEYVRDSKLLDNITEFQSINFHLPGAVFFEISLFLALAAAGWCVTQRLYGSLFSVVLWGHLALFSARNVPLFLLMVSPVIACALTDALRRARELPLFSKTGQIVAEIADEFGAHERLDRWHPLSILALLVVGLLFASRDPRFACTFKAANFPVTGIAALERAHPSRIFTYDQWADYLLYQFYPKQKVFMDGRSDFFGSDFVTTYQHIVSARYDCERELNRFGIDTVLVRPEEALATVLKQSVRWKLVFDDGKVAIFRSANAVPEEQSSRPQVQERRST